MNSLTPGQQEVLNVLRLVKQPLPDHVLVPLVQHIGELLQPSSGIRSRRAELLRTGCVEQALATTKMPSGRHAKQYLAR